eukprot:scaffold281538_cov36-Tisochrysis_lutea.AAC.4
MRGKSGGSATWRRKSTRTRAPTRCDGDCRPPRRREVTAASTPPRSGVRGGRRNRSQRGLT